MHVVTALRGALVAGALVVLGSCAGYQVELELCGVEGCINITPHVVHLEELEPKE